MQNTGKTESESLEPRESQTTQACSERNRGNVVEVLFLGTWSFKSSAIPVSSSEDCQFVCLSRDVTHSLFGPVELFAC